MALSKNVRLKNNFNEESVFNNAYIKVSSFSGNKHHLNFVVETRKSKEGDLLKKENFLFAPAMNEQNFIAQAYAYLKTLPEFAGATDC